MAFMGGLIGGFLSGRLFNHNLAFAQSNKGLKVIEANEFRIVDKKGKMLAVFKGTPSIRYRDQNISPIPEMAILDFISDKREYDIRITQDGIWLDGDTSWTQLSSFGLLSTSRENGMSVKIGKMMGILSPIEIWDKNKNVLWKAP